MKCQYNIVSIKVIQTLLSNQHVQVNVPCPFVDCTSNVIMT